MTISTRPTDSPESIRSQESAGGVREVARLAVPIVLTNISITLMQIVDSAMVGRLGAAELAAVGFGGVWLWTVMCFFVGTTTCIQTFVAQNFGSGREDRCGSWTWQGLYAVLPLGVVTTLLLFFGGPSLIRWLQPDPQIVPHAAQYLHMRALGNAGMIGAVALSSFFRGLGDTRTPLYTTVTANVLNAVLDYGLIYGKLGLPEMGVAGAGLATSIAEWTNFVILGFCFAQPHIVSRYHTKRVAPDRSQIRRLLRTGVPVGGQWWLEMTSFAAFLTIVARMGDAPMAASQAFVALLAISFMQAIGLSIAVSTLVGQYIGSGNIAAAERSFGSGVRLSLVFAGFIAVLFYWIPEPLLRLFSDDPRVIELGVPLLWIGAIFQIFDAVSIIADGGLRGAGDTRWPMVMRFLLAWGVFLPSAWSFGIHLDGGLAGCGWGGLVYVLLLTAVLVRRFQSGQWKMIKI